jgi:hypothetical protein
MKSLLDKKLAKEAEAQAQTATESQSSDDNVVDAEFTETRN